MDNLTISDKQHQAIALLQNPSIVELFMGGSGGGPQPLDAIVKTPAGDRAIGDLEVGDKVLSYTGDVQEVIDIPYEGKGLVFEITLESGRKVQAEENHLFPFKLADKKRPELLKVKDYIYSLDSWKEENQPELYVSENGKKWSEKIASYKLIGRLPVRCISVSNLDGLYLTNDFIVTHNSKTFTMAMMVILTVRQYAGCRLFVGRKTLKSLRQSFIHTLLGQVHKMFDITEDDFKYSGQAGEITYANGSVVMFGELMKNPSDPDFARFGSLEIDMAFVEEAGEVSLEAKNAIRSRVGRGVMAKTEGIPGKLILSGNPSQNFLRTEYYDPYLELGGGEYQSWKIGETTAKYRRRTMSQVKKIEMKRCFLRMSVYQNPFIPQSYIDNLKTLPARERKRLLDGNWDYADDESSLFKSGLIDKAITYELPQPSEKFNKVIGVDVSDSGGDRSVFSLIDNGVLVAQKLSNVQLNWDKSSEEPLSYLIANELIEFAQQNGFQQINAKNIAVESNGVGVGCLPAGELVLTTKGPKQIQLVDGKDTLIDHNGLPTRIVNKQIYTNAKEKLYKLKIGNTTQTVTFTGEHPIWSSRKRDGQYSFVPASQIKVNDWLEMPNVYSEVKPMPDLSEYDFDYWTNSNRTIRMNDIVQERDFWWLVGYWLGDGWIQTQNRPDRPRNSREVHFCFSPEQRYYLEKIQNISQNLLSRKATEYKKPRVDNVVIRCRGLTDFLEDTFGQKAGGKNIADWVKYIPHSLKRELIAGYIESDGTMIRAEEKRSSNTVYYKMSMRSISKKLLEDFRDILDSIGIVGVVRLMCPARVETINGKVCHCKPSYTLSFGAAATRKFVISRHNESWSKLNKDIPPLIQKDMRKNAFVRGNKIYRRIIEIEQSYIEGTVYNFETESHTFMCPNVLTHNCRDALRVRGWNLTEYVATSKSRSEGYYNLMLNMDAGDVKIYKDISTIGELRKELSAHTYEMENQEPKVLKKAKVKEALGRSPDLADSFMIASWMWDRKANPQKDPKRNAKRISW